MCEQLSDIINVLTHAFGCSGREDSVRKLIRSCLPDNAGNAIREDSFGNLLVQTGHRGGPRVMLDAHMDCVGIMLTDVSDTAKMRFRAIGFLFPETMLGATMVFENGQMAVVESNAEKGLGMALSSLYLRALNSDDTFRIGDTAIYKPDYVYSGGFATGTFLDNRAGCAALLMSIKEMEKSPNEVWCCFSVQEEVGMRGAAVAARTIRPEIAFAVDMGIAEPGSGIIEKMMDDSIICDPFALQILENAAQKADVPIMRVVGGAGYTNAGGIHIAGTGCPTAILGIPARNIHSPREKICLADVVACRKTLIEIANTEWRK